METRKSISVPRHRKLDTAVLRQAPLRNIEPRHDLDAGRDCRREARGRAFRLVQHAVVAIAEAQLVLERFDVDVRRLRLDGALDNLVHKSNDRCLAREILQSFGIVLQSVV